MNSKAFARLTAVLLAVVLTLSLAGCRSADKSSETAAGNAPAVSQAATETDPKPAKDTSAKKTKKLPSTTAVKEETTGETGTSTAKKTGTASHTKQKTVTKKTTSQNATAAPKRGSLVADVYDLSTDAARKLLNGTVDFGTGGLQYLNPSDTGISVRVRTKRTSGGGVQLYLVVKNNTGRPIRLNGYSRFAIRDLLGNELLSTNIRLNQPVVMKDQDEKLFIITLPREWYAFDDLYQLTVEAGIFQSLIALDYEFL
ncbi:MAG: hypothetical protein IJC96_00480 [Clostridia bacterium]|nr:hypothetical protein [Clostridia bacterium]